MITILSICFLSVNSQSLLSYFHFIENDTIINTGDDILSRIGVLCLKFRDNPIPDSITLKYFFNNDTTNMYYEDIVSDLEFPDSTYIYILKKEFCPLFCKEFFKNYFLICYDIDNIIYMSIYDSDLDTIISSYIVSDYTDEYGNQVTHSIIFPNNYIASVETKWGGDVFYKLIKIDIDKKEFVLIKNIKTSGRGLNDQEIYKKIHQILGINDKGELIK